MAESNGFFDSICTEQVIQQFEQNPSLALSTASLFSKSILPDCGCRAGTRRAECTVRISCCASTQTGCESTSDTLTRGCWRVSLRCSLSRADWTQRRWVFAASWIHAVLRRYLTLLFQYRTSLRCGQRRPASTLHRLSDPVLLVESRSSS